MLNKEKEVQRPDNHEVIKGLTTVLFTLLSDAQTGIDIINEALDAENYDVAREAVDTLSRFFSMTQTLIEENLKMEKPN